MCLPIWGVRRSEGLLPLCGFQEANSYILASRKIDFTNWVISQSHDAPLWKTELPEWNDRQQDPRGNRVLCGYANDMQMRLPLGWVPRDSGSWLGMVCPLSFPTDFALSLCGLYRDMSTGFLLHSSSSQWASAGDKSNYRACTVSRFHRARTLRDNRGAALSVSLGSA